MDFTLQHEIPVANLFWRLDSLTKLMIIIFNKIQHNLKDLFMEMNVCNIKALVNLKKFSSKPKSCFFFIIFLKTEVVL